MRNTWKIDENGYETEKFERKTHEFMKNRKKITKIGCFMTEIEENIKWPPKKGWITLVAKIEKYKIIMKDRRESTQNHYFLNKNGRFHQKMTKKWRFSWFFDCFIHFFLVPFNSFLSLNRICLLQKEVFGTFSRGSVKCSRSRRVGWADCCSPVLSGGITGFMTAPSMAKSLYFIFRGARRGVLKTRWNAQWLKSKLRPV